MVQIVGVSSGGGVVAMGMAEVTTLHSRGIGKPELSPSLKAESSLLGDFSWMACSDGDPLRAMPMNMTPEPFPLRNRPWSSERLAMNLRPSKRMVSSWVSSTLY
jgi:hypothetical protein